MDKSAQTNYTIHPVLKKRWSPRAFSNTPVEKEKLQRVLEAARWSASSFNEQPWRFFVGMRGDNTYDKIMESLVPFNQSWAQTAPVLMLVCSKKNFSGNGKPNAVSQYDAGQAAAHISFQATEEGLHLHQMGGFDPDKARELFNVPEEFEIHAGIALGYIGDPEVLPEDLKESEVAKRERMHLSDIVFEDEFNTPSNIISGK